MATGADIQNALNAIFGNNGANLTNLTVAVQNLNPGQPRELSLVKVDPFHRRDDEDPVEWLDTFNRAAIANHWTTEARKKQVAGGYMKDAAASWFTTNATAMGDNFNTGTGTNNQNFTDLFNQQFASDSKKNMWYQQLMNLRQSSTEGVDAYADRFLKLVNRVGLTDDVQKKRMFLFGLNPALTPMVHMQNPADVGAAIN